ncbi:alcohol oxidase [Mycena maculata]|uniref:Alcohol oxidase n=1 Tax=Mycena maculata TaxID=230809 RepID=A0AAD7HS05_9AGAR|nr:alcohol oxidase [Mycena maculata]
MRAATFALYLTSAFALSTPVYDYVVVGGGTAGLTVANRLTEDKNISVAVIEAGFNAEDLPEVFIPGLIGTGISMTTLDWAYATVPQENLNGRTLTVNAGKALGGSTVINSMIFPRAEKQQYDVWGQLNNDSTWTWPELLPFFKKSEICTPPNAFQTTSGVRFLESVHGFSGLVKVGFPNFFFQQSALWRRATEGLGFPASPDLADGDPHAVGIAPNSIDAANNTRCSAACAYYTPFSGRENLVVITNATVSRILWANSSGPNSELVASGVEFLVNNRTQTVGVSREVILSAGTIGSPKVLELSGVGNSTILRAAGVTPVLNLPTVGENFADHVHSWANSFTNITLTKDVLLLNPAFAAEQEALWFKNRTGLYSAVPRSMGIAAPSDVFDSDELSTLIARAEANLTYFANQFSNGNPALAKGIAAQHEIALGLYRKNQELPLEINVEPGYSGPTAFSARPARNYTSINSMLDAPLSRGRTHIVSSDPLIPPAVDPAYWSHPFDIAVQVGGIKLARKMLVAPPLDSIYAGEFEPGVDKDTDADIEEWLRGVVASDNHEVGSLSMMPQSFGGVVDTSLKVYGTTNVRAADASIIPFTVSAHLESTVYMIGERAANIIRGVQA